MYSNSCLVHWGYHGSALQTDAAEESGDVRSQGLFCVLDRRLAPILELALGPEQVLEGNPNLDVSTEVDCQIASNSGTGFKTPG